MSGTPGLAAAAIVKPVDAPIGLPPISSPWFNRLTMLTSPLRPHRRPLSRPDSCLILAGRPCGTGCFEGRWTMLRGGRLNAGHVAVTAGVVQNRLDTGLLLNLNAEALRAHAGGSSRRIGHIDDVDAEAGERLAPASSFQQSMPFGGTISTIATNPPSRMRRPRRERSSMGAGGVSVTMGARDCAKGWSSARPGHG